MRMKLTGLWLLLIVMLGLTGCFWDKDPNANQAVCIYEPTGIRVDPAEKGTILSSMSLGETATFEGKPVIDQTNANKPEFIKVKLSDGTKGWVKTWCVVMGAYVGVIQEPAKIYKRPDLLSETEKKFDTMDILAVEEESGDWLRVTGEGRTKTGWVQKSMIRTSKEDVVTAVLLKKAINKKKGAFTQEEAETTVATLPYPNNYFALKALEKYTPVTVDDYSEEVIDDSGSEGTVNVDTTDSEAGEYEGD